MPFPRRQGSGRQGRFACWLLVGMTRGKGRFPAFSCRMVQQPRCRMRSLNCGPLLELAEARRNLLGAKDGNRTRDLLSHSEPNEPPSVDSKELAATPPVACTSACTPKAESLNETAPATPAGDGQDRGFAEAVRAVMALPLTDAEKAEAVRRLLAGAASRP